MRRFLSILPNVAIVAALLLALPAAAQTRDAVARDVRLPTLETMQANGVSLNQAVEQVRRQCRGRIVSAETQVSGNRETHVIKCLTDDGKVRTFRIPGKRRG